MEESFSEEQEEEGQEDEREEERERIPEVVVREPRDEILNIRNDSDEEADDDMNDDEEFKSCDDQGW